MSKKKKEMEQEGKKEQKEDLRFSYSSMRDSTGRSSLSIKPSILSLIHPAAAREAPTPAKRGRINLNLV